MQTLWILSTFIAVSSPNFIGTQCGNKICGRNALCVIEGTGEDALSSKCTCAEGFLGLPHETCFKTCLRDRDCPGPNNRCVYHDAYFPRYKSVSFFMFNYPYSHHHCLYDCSVDDDCGKNALCQTEDEGKKCACPDGFLGLPYLQCFKTKLKPALRKTVNEDYVRCPIVPSAEGLKISCIDRDGTEHDCSTGGVPGTSAMFLCKTHYVPSKRNLRFSRMKCGRDGKWSKSKIFHCNKSTSKFNLGHGFLSGEDYF